MTQGDFDPPVGVPIALEPGLRCVLAPNPSAMTFRGTNTYLLGARDIAVVDPGPDSTDHLAALSAALEPDQRITHIFVTHSHLDHSALAPRLAKATGAPVHGFGSSDKGRCEAMQKLARAGVIGGGEGIDAAFSPDELLKDGERVSGDGWTLEALWTPGHMSNHLSFAWKDTVFTGDVVMGWATSLVSPPDGELGQFLASCKRLEDLQARRFYPGHGAPVLTPSLRARDLIDHRMQRHRSIRAALSEQPRSISEIVARVYDDLPPGLERAAARNVFAHLVALCQAGQATAESEISPSATFTGTDVEKK